MKHHSEALELLGLQNSPEGERSSRLVHQLFLPEAVREWYELPEAAPILTRCSNGDQGVPLDQLTGEDPLPFLRRGSERWAVLLNEGPNPPVVHRARSGAPWAQVCRSFSDFILARVWSYHQAIHPERGCLYRDSSEPLSPVALATLWTEFDPGPQILDEQWLDYRFRRGSCYLWAGARPHRSFCAFSASSPAEWLEVTRLLWPLVKPLTPWLGEMAEDILCTMSHYLVVSPEECWDRISGAEHRSSSVEGCSLCSPVDEPLIEPLLDYLIDRFSDYQKREIAKGLVAYCWQAQDCALELIAQEGVATAWWLKASTEMELSRLIRLIEPWGYLRPILAGSRMGSD